MYCPETCLGTYISGVRRITISGMITINDRKDMSKYNEYGVFMQEVVNTAEKSSSTPLSSLYGVESDTVGMVLSVLGKGWVPFASMTSIFGLALISFVAALAAFVITPIGVVVIAALIYWGGKDAIRILYYNRTLPLAIKAVGDTYKERFDSHVNEQRYIDSLINEAADDLIRRASKK